MSPSQLELLLCWRQIEPREEIARLLLQPGKDEVIKGKPTRRLLRAPFPSLFFIWFHGPRRRKDDFNAGWKELPFHGRRPKQRHPIRPSQRLDVTDSNKRSVYSTYLFKLIAFSRLIKKKKHNSCGHGQWLTYQPSRIRDGLVDSSSSTEPKWGNWRAIDGRWPVYIEDQTAHITARRRED